MNQNLGEEYISAFPKFKKWINECMCCHRKGYDPSMPEHIGHNDYNLGAHYIRKYFEPLAVNKCGLCPQCERFFEDESCMKIAAD